MCDMAGDFSQGLEQDAFRGICACIAEFLCHERLDGTLEVFNTETASTATRRVLVESQHVTPEPSLLLQQFDQGDCKGFFSLWHSRASETLRVDSLRKLEFWLQLYFALHPVLVGQSNNSSLSQTLPVFKQYLNANGPLLANDPQFLSYYALPYVPRPQSHPAFAHIFAPTFVPDLRSQLTNVLRSAPVKPALPRLYSMYAAAQAAGQLPSTAALPSDEESLQHGQRSTRGNQRSSAAIRPISRAVHSSSRPVSGTADRELHGTGRPVSGAASMGLTGNSQRPTRPAGMELTGNLGPLSGAASMGLNGTIRPISGRLQASRRPVSALLNGSKELAELVSVSKPRYTDQSAAPSLEPSAEVLHVVHSEGSEMGISAEVSLLEAELGHAIQPDAQASATVQAALSPDAVAGSQFTNQGSNEAATQSHEVLRQASRGHPSFLALEAAGQVASVDEGSIAMVVQRDSTAPGGKDNAAAETRHALELLAASRSSQSLAASAGSASKPSSLAASAKTSLSSQLPQARHVGSSASGSRQFRPDSATKAVSRSHSIGGLASFHASGPDPAHTVDIVQSRLAGEGCLPDGDFSKQADANTAASQPMSASSQYATVSAKSSRGPSPVTQDPAQLACNAVEAAEHACIIDSIVDDMCVAASLSRDATGDGMLLDAGNKPAYAAAAAGVVSSTSSIAASTDTEHKQTARDVSVSLAPVRSSMNSLDKAADVDVALSRTTQKAGHTTAEIDTAVKERSSSGSEVAQALAGGTPVLGHAQPERSVSPLLPAARGASLSEDQTSVVNGKTSVSTDSARESCLRGPSLAAAADQGESSPGASPTASSVKGIDSMGPSLPRSGQRAATPVNTSLSQLGKAGGAGVIRHSVTLTGLDPLDQWLYRHPSVLASLDYDKVKADLQGVEAGLTAALLQALRWRLDKAATASDRCQVLASFIENDILTLREPRAGMLWSDSSSSSGSSKAASSGVSEQWTRLMGTLADSQAGRAYLCTSLAPVVQQLCHGLQPDTNISHSQEKAQSWGLSEYALEALQKLSLRRETRSVMAENGIIKWLAGQLSQLDAMPLSSLECCGALLMNLAMARPGRQECQQVGLLVPLESLLEHDSMRVQTYANATLYSLLREPDIRKSARTKGTYELLQHIQADARPVIARQIGCVLKHWHALEAGKSAEEGWAEMDAQEDDDLQDAHTGAGDGLDEAESIHSWDQLHGERLLASQYLQEQPSTMCSLQHAPVCTSVSIQEMGVVLTTALSHNLASVTHQVFPLEKQTPQHPALIPALHHVNRSGEFGALMPAKLPKLIPAAKQEEYFAAFGSQTKLPRTPLLP